MPVGALGLSPPATHGEYSCGGAGVSRVIAAHSPGTKGVLAALQKMGACFFRQLSG